MVGFIYLLSRIVLLLLLFFFKFAFEAGFYLFIFVFIVSFVLINLSVRSFSPSLIKNSFIFLIKKREKLKCIEKRMIRKNRKGRNIPSKYKNKARKKKIRTTLLTKLVLIFVNVYVC